MTMMKNRDLQNLFEPASADAFPYHAHLMEIALNDVELLLDKDVQYKGSCFRRGGSGLFHMFARKWDRIEAMVEDCGYDIFEAVENDTRMETVLDDVADLRRYLLLAEAFLLCKRLEELVGDNPIPSSQNSSATLVGGSKAPSGPGLDEPVRKT